MITARERQSDNDNQYAVVLDHNLMNVSLTIARVRERVGHERHEIGGLCYFRLLCEGARVMLL